MKTLVFFNNKGGVGKTSLVYHLAWIYAELGIKVIVADLDPQANLSAIFLTEDQMEEMWSDNEHKKTIMGALTPLIRGTGDIEEPYIKKISDNIGLIIGDLGLSGIEDDLSSNWPVCLEGKERAFRVISAFYRILAKAAERESADLVLIDVGPNLGAINRAAIIAADYVVVPMAPDLYSLQGLRNLGPSLTRWRKEWKDRLNRVPTNDLLLPQGKMSPVGYIILQHIAIKNRPVKAYSRWIDRIPGEYNSSVLERKLTPPNTTITNDDNCLAQIRHYRSLMPMAMEARKPMFFLKPSDGAIGSHMSAVKDCYLDFNRLAKKIAIKCDINIPNTNKQIELFVFNEPFDPISEDINS